VVSLVGRPVMHEAQEFAPSGLGTPCWESTLRLVAQTRRYGLDMLFATPDIAPLGQEEVIKRAGGM
jgi:hypothetical protein